MAFETTWPQSQYHRIVFRNMFSTDGFLTVGVVTLRPCICSQFCEAISPELPCLCRRSSMDEFTQMRQPLLTGRHSEKPQFHHREEDEMPHSTHRCSCPHSSGRATEPVQLAMSYVSSAPTYHGLIVK